METLKLGQTLETRQAQVLLDPALKPGKYRMQLRVISPSGESEPAELRIVVLERRVLDPRLPVPPVIRIEESRVPPVTPLTTVTPAIRGVDPQVIGSVRAPMTAKSTAKPKPGPEPKSKPKPPGKPKRK